MAPALTTRDASFAHQTASQVATDTMPFGLQLLGQGSCARRRSRRLVMPDQRGFELIPLRICSALALAPSVETTAVDSERPTTPFNAVLLVQLIDQRE